MKTLGVGLCAVLLATGCATTSPDVTDVREARQMAEVREGVLLAVRPVVVAHRPTGMGAVVGGVAGAVVAGGGPGMRHRRGTLVPRDAAGLVAGAVIGQLVEQRMSQEPAVELLVALHGGGRVAVVQGLGVQPLAPGDRVAVVGRAGSYRVVLQ